MLLSRPVSRNTRPAIYLFKKGRSRSGSKELDRRIMKKILSNVSSFTFDGLSIYGKYEEDFSMM